MTETKAKVIEYSPAAAMGNHIQLKIDDKEYKLAPLGPYDFGSMEQKWKSQNIDLITKAVTNRNLSVSVQSKAISDAMVQPFILEEYLRSYEGMQYAIYLSINKGNPNAQMVHSTFMNLIKQLDTTTLNDIGNALIYMSFGIDPNEVKEEVPLEGETVQDKEEPKHW